MGYAVFGYWYFFNSDEAAPILDSHVSFDGIYYFQFVFICLPESLYSSILYSLWFSLLMKQSGRRILGQSAP